MVAAMATAAKRALDAATLCEAFHITDHVMVGYRNEPEKTAEAIDADCWLHSGDIAQIDGDGYVRIVDRKKENTVLDDEWQPGGEELTPTMKLRRKPIAAKYADEIEALYR